MPSKSGKVWDLWASIVDSFSSGDSIQIFQLGEPLFEILLRNEWRSLSGQSLRIEFGKELKVDQFENWTEADLFSSEENIAIFNSEEMKKKEQEWLIENYRRLSQKKIFFFTKSSQFLKKSDFQRFQVKEAMFWEQDRLFDFLCHKADVKLDHKDKKYILENIESTVDDYWSVLQRLVLGSGENIEKILLGLTHKKESFFDLADELQEKRFLSFFQNALELKNSWIEAESLFRFLSGHFIKVADPSSLLKKPKLSRYDQKICHASKTWRQEEVARVLKQLSEWEMRCRLKDPSLWQDLEGKLVKLQA